jgi:MFS family permease
MPPGSLPLIVTLSIQALTALTLVSISILAPSAAPEIGVPATYVGIFVGLMFLGAICATLLSGGLIHRYGAIRVSQIALLLCAAGLLALIIGSPWLLIFSALLIGFGYGPITPASSYVLMKTTPRHLMSLIFSIKQTGVPLGGVLAGLLVPPLVIAFNWRGAAGVIALACIVVAWSAESARRQIDTDLEPDHLLSLKSLGAPLKLIWAVPTLRLLSISSFFFTSIQVCLTTFLIPYLTIQMKFSLVAAGLVFSVTQASGVAGRILWGFLADRMVSAPLMLSVLAVAMTSASVLAALIGPGDASIATMGLFAIFGAAAIGWNGVYLAELARQSPPGQIGMATGGSMSMTFLGAVVGPPLFGLIVEWSGSYALAFMLTGLPAIACGIALFRWQGEFAKPA